MEGDWTWGGEHTIQYTDDISQNYAPETYVILLTNVTPKNSIKNVKGVKQKNVFVPEPSESKLLTRYLIAPVLQYTFPPHKRICYVTTYSHSNSKTNSDTCHCPTHASHSGCTTFPSKFLYNERVQSAITSGIYFPPSLEYSSL